MTRFTGRARYGPAYGTCGSGLFKIAFLILVVLGLANFFFGRKG
ncbi:hypothetical protein [Piscinibacter sakaiensis]